MVLKNLTTFSPHSYGSPAPLLSAAAADAQEEETTHSPPPSLTLSFNNLSYTVKSRRSLMTRLSSAEPESKLLLNDISGSAKNGEILAVLGPSGSGKSTLIDALANRIMISNGTIDINGQKLESNSVKVISTYVMQDDLLFPMLTVEETLMFAAEFRLSKALSKSQKKERVRDLIDQLDLGNAVHTMIGDEGHRGISGGERRRISIGIDIIHNPILLFLDEPTTGLDSTGAFMVVNVLKRIAQNAASIVIMSIHQPSYRVLGLLNRLILLSHGQVVYCGSPSNLPNFLADFGHPQPEDENPVEAALDLIIDLENTPKMIESLVDFNKSWNNMMNPSVSSVSERTKSRFDYEGNLNITEVQRFANTLWTEILVLSKRSFLNARRLPELLVIRFGVAIFTAVIFATVYWNLDNSPKGNEERVTFLGFGVATIYYVSAEGFANYIQERSVIKRETAYNAYRKFSYWLSYSLVWLPSLFLLSMVFSTITFWGIGLNGGLRGFLFYWGMVFASFWTGNAFVTLIIELIPQVFLGYIILNALLSWFFFFCGLFITRDKIPNYWIWFHYLSLNKYTFQGLMKNEFGDSRKCLASGIQWLDNLPLVGSTATIDLKEKFLNSTSEILGKNITCFTSGKDILKDKGITDLSKWGSFWIVIAWGLLFKVLFYLALLRKRR
ncbi:hypothetical protein M9H77_28699 [Catharanthus roseus]|uniref:Uncharacterized protein n=1 Tax=Catharanthus roseus TaxID=4058 RepID=A0ACC0AGP7_CATRO|nr:hypothetical protein M9H77_28699 [Catharanthus roseus]